MPTPTTSPRAHPERTDPERMDPISNDYARYAGVGVQFAMTILVLGALGYWADHRFGTGPWLMVVGIALGSVGGFVSLVRKFPAPSRPPRGARRTRGDAPPKP